MELHLHFLNLQYVGLVTTTTRWKYSVCEYGDYLALFGQVTMVVLPFQCNSKE